MFKFKNTKLLLSAAVLLTAFTVFVGAQQASACSLRELPLGVTRCPDGSTPTDIPAASAPAAPQSVPNLNLNPSDLGNTETRATGETVDDRTGNAPGVGPVPEECSVDNVTADNCKIVAYLLLFINILSAAVGVVIVIMVTVGGIQYSTARDNPQATKAARTRIYNAVFALVVYLFGFAFLQWIIPGGIL